MRPGRRIYIQPRGCCGGLLFWLSDLNNALDFLILMLLLLAGLVWSHLHLNASPPNFIMKDASDYDVVVDSGALKTMLAQIDELTFLFTVYRNMTGE